MVQTQFVLVGSAHCFFFNHGSELQRFVEVAFVLLFARLSLKLLVLPLLGVDLLLQLDTLLAALHVMSVVFKLLLNQFLVCLHVLDFDMPRNQFRALLPLVALIEKCRKRALRWIPLRLVGRADHLEVSDIGSRLAPVASGQYVVDLEVVVVMGKLAHLLC